MDEFSVIRRRFDNSDSSEKYKLLGCYESMESAEKSLSVQKDVSKGDIIIICDTAEICDYHNHRNIYIVDDDRSIRRCRNFTKDGIVGLWEGVDSRADNMLNISIGSGVSHKYIMLSCVEFFAIASSGAHTSRVSKALDSARRVVTLIARGNSGYFCEIESIRSDLEYCELIYGESPSSMAIASALHLMSTTEKVNAYDSQRIAALASMASGKTHEELSDVVRRHIPLRRLLIAQAK